MKKALLIGVFLLTMICPAIGEAASRSTGAGSVMVHMQWNHQSVLHPFLNPSSWEIDVQVITQSLFLGAIGEFMMASSLSATPDQLTLVNAGLEAGISWLEPRFFLQAGVGAMLPVLLTVVDGAGDLYVVGDRMVNFMIRVRVGVRLVPRVAFLFGGGYRWIEFGSLTGPGTYNGGALPLSGASIFLGLSLLI